MVKLEWFNQLAIWVYSTRGRSEYFAHEIMHFAAGDARLEWEIMGCVHNTILHFADSGTVSGFCV